MKLDFFFWVIFTSFLTGMCLNVCVMVGMP